ncbi:MAG: DUF1887 family protein [Clostridiales bacterium]|nr:DUF1887 family protein [Candidatus Cacconaster stercorequi]
MKTLIELYDERPIENVLGSEVFRPQRTVFLCPGDVAQDKVLQDKLRRYFAHRGLTTEPVFLESGLFSSTKILKQLRAVVKSYPDCVLDITGGTDAALFAAGQLCAESDIPVFTYSRRRRRFFNIHNAPFAEELVCSVQHTVEDCFLMAGGTLREGRVDNAILGQYMDKIDPFFRLYLNHRTHWPRIVGYMQRASQVDKDLMLPIPLHVDAPYTVKGERGSRIDAPEAALRDFEALGFLHNVRISSDRVSFDFHDLQIRTWLRDIGSVLELYIYKCCLDAGIFNDVHTSAIVDWDGVQERDGVTNEIDVMAMQGIVPVFISCKTCDVTTEALNELAILRDRFGGKAAKAAIVTTQRCRNVTRHRAAELCIDVVDLEDLRAKRIIPHLQSMMQQF